MELKDLKQTNFFTQIFALLGDDLDLTITIKREKQGGGPTGASRLIVGVRPQYSDKADHPLNTIKPILLIHDPDKLDEGFFPTIVSPMMAVKELHEQVEQFTKDVTTAKEDASKKPEGKTKSAAATTKPAKEAPAKKEAKPAAPKVDKAAEKLEKTNKAAEELMVKAEKLSGEKKFKEALATGTKAIKLKDGFKDDVATNMKERFSVIEKAKERADIDKQVKPLILKANELKNKYNFDMLGKTLYQIFKLDPDNVEATAIKTEIETRLGKDAVTKMISK